MRRTGTLAATLIGISVIVLLCPIATGRSVILESFSNTQCPDCHATNRDLRTLYYDDDLGFVYVTLVENKVDLASARMDDYAPMGHSFPLVQVDGSYRSEEGKRTIDEYRDDIEDAVERQLPALDLSIEIHARGPAEVTLKARARTETDEIHVRIIVYLVEAESRYRDEKGRRYAFGMLDTPIDANVTLSPGAWWTNETSWRGSEHAGSKGDSYADADVSNLNAIVGVFHAGSGEPRVALAGAMAVPPVLRPDDIPANVTGQCIIGGRAWGNVTRGLGIGSVEFRIDGGDWLEFDDVSTFQAGQDGNRSVTEFRTVWNSTDVENGTHVIEVRTFDTSGSSARSEWTVDVVNDDFVPPSIRFLRPDAGTVNGTVQLAVSAWDRNPLEVTLAIGNDAPVVVGSSNGTFVLEWDTMSSPEGKIAVTASALDGAFTVSRNRIFLVDNDASPVHHSAVSPDRPVAGVASLSVTFQDDSPFLDIAMVYGQIPFVPYSTSSTPLGDRYLTTTEFDIDTMVLPDGTVRLLAKAEDDHGQRAWSNLSLDVDNTAPAATFLALAWNSTWNVSWSPTTTDTSHFRVFVSSEPLEDLTGLAPYLETEWPAWSPPRSVVPCYVGVVAVDHVGNAGAASWEYLGEPPDLEIAIQGIEDAVPRGATVNLTITVSNGGEVSGEGALLLVFLGPIEIHNGTLRPIPPNGRVSVSIGVPVKKDTQITAFVSLGADQSMALGIVRVEGDDSRTDVGGLTAAVLMICLVISLTVFAIHVKRIAR